MKFQQQIAKPFRMKPRTRWPSFRSPFGCAFDKRILMRICNSKVAAGAKRDAKAGWMPVIKNAKGQIITEGSEHGKKPFGFVARSSAIQAGELLIRYAPQRLRAPELILGEEQLDLPFPRLNSFRRVA